MYKDVFINIDYKQVIDEFPQGYKKIEDVIERFYKA